MKALLFVCVHVNLRAAEVAVKQEEQTVKLPTAGKVKRRKYRQFKASSQATAGLHMMVLLSK